MVVSGVSTSLTTLRDETYVVEENRNVVEEPQVL